MFCFVLGQIPPAPSLPTIGTHWVRWRNFSRFSFPLRWIEKRQLRGWWVPAWAQDLITAASTSRPPLPPPATQGNGGIINGSPVHLLSVFRLYPIIQPIITCRQLGFSLDRGWRESVRVGQGCCSDHCQGDGWSFSDSLPRPSSWKCPHCLGTRDGSFLR